MGKDNKKVQVAGRDGAAGFVFFLAWVGALVYFVQQASGFGGLILAFLKACVWPAYLVYYVFRLLHV